METDAGSTYCTAWAGAALAGFSVVSGKQIYYLVAELPAFALLIAYAFKAAGPPRRSLFPKTMAAVYGLAGLLLALAPSLPLRKLPFWAKEISPAWGILIVIAAAALLFVSSARAIRAISSITVIVMVFLQAAVFRAARPAFDLTAAAAKIAEFEAAGKPVAFVGNYHGQFQFLGRLRHPLEETGNPTKAILWARAHPRGVIVTVCDPRIVLPESELAHLQPYRAKRLALWPAAAVLKNPVVFLSAARDS